MTFDRHHLELQSLAKSVNFNSFIVSSDEFDPIPAYKRPIGYGGIAVLWSKSLDGQITPVEAYTTRTQAVVIKNSPRDILLINAYMPTRGYTSSSSDYLDTLASIHEVIQKYAVNRDVILMGDMNARIFSEDIRYSQDNFFHRFCQECSLTIPDCFLRGIPTFAAHNTTSTIDGIFAVNHNMIVNCQILDRVPTSSSHVPLELKLRISVDIGHQQRTTQPDVKIPLKLQWMDCDNDVYIKLLSTNISNLRVQASPPSINATLDALHEILTNAAEHSVPSKKRPQKPNMPWNVDITVAMKTHKRCLSEWVLAGRPHPDHPLSVARHASKKVFRSVTRRTTALSREKFYSCIMETHSASDKMFFNLVNQQRQNHSHDGLQLEVDGNIISDRETVLKAWRLYFAKLSTPSSNPIFDDSYHDAMLEDLSRIEDITSHKPACESPITSIEVMLAIKKLNRGKATDPNGLSAEHLQHGSAIIAQILADLFNAMLTAQHIPDPLRLGCLTPIWKKGKPHLDPSSYRGITVTSIIDIGTCSAGTFV